MLFSIITVSLNAENLISETLNSALNQTFNDFEIIVKDGLSKDKTLDMIPNDDRIKIISKKDSGIYQAMNQAISQARGQYLVFMNCGDRFYSNDVLDCVAKIIQKGGADIIYGNRYSLSCGEIVYPSKVSKQFFYSSTICHQASFIKKELFEILGPYDEKLKIASDWKFFLEAKISGAKFLYCNKIFCWFLDGGVSESELGLRQGKNERKCVIKQKYNIFERKIYNTIEKISKVWCK